jgi:hypothetical protein
VIQDREARNQQLRAQAQQYAPQTPYVSPVQGQSSIATSSQLVPDEEKEPVKIEISQKVDAEVNS